ncbi:MAG TPA: GNAT family N-acetyltransferase [Rhizomicrobium sp.]|nr:GNAT family N-acetyltransferase [Rhizomicrobium sp.]
MPCFRLESERLLLRVPEAFDAPAVAALMNDWDVARNLSMAPFPYLEDHARDFIGRQEDGRAKGTDFVFVITRKSDGALMGKCGLHLKDGPGFEMGYWLGRPYWGQGYATEAAAEVLAFGFRNLRADPIWAGWFHDNPASGRVLEKLGFKPNGSDRRDSAARGQSVLCNLVTMSRADFGQRQAA